MKLCCQHSTALGSRPPWGKALCLIRAVNRSDIWSGGSDVITESIFILHKSHMYLTLVRTLVWMWIQRKLSLSIHMLMPRYQKACINMANRSFNDVVKFKYLGTTLTDQNYVHEEIKSRQNSGNACYHSVHSLLSSRLLSRNVKVKIYRTIILPLVLCGCETWSLT
jgi:hypothetical protein